MRGKAWSIDEERLLRRLVQEGKGTQEISQIMGKSRVSVKAKLSNLCLSVVVATGLKCAVATASSLAFLHGCCPIFFLGCFGIKVFQGASCTIAAIKSSLLVTLLL